MAILGGLYRPHQIVRIAKAEAQAQIIAANARVDVGDIEQRAAQRWVAEETRKQENIESITRKAIPLLEENAKPGEMENDWVANFFDKSRITSDEEIQTLWAKVLAGEANSPGKFSRRTVNMLGDLDKKDALLFSELCNFVWSHGQPMIFDSGNAIYNNAGINFGSLTHLDSLGLITFNNIVDFSFQRLPEDVVFGYQNRALRLKKPVGHDLPIGKVMFTNAGRELSSIVQVTNVAGYFEHVMEVFPPKGIQVIPF